MNRTVMSAAALALVGAGAIAFAQTQSPPAVAPAAPAVGMSGMAGMRASAEDRAVLLDARIGAIKAALKLTADQEKLWEPVEAFIRKSAVLQDQRIQEMRDRMAQVRDGLPPVFDPIARLRAQADRMTARAGRMREFADAAAPLYASLTDDQKRRAFLLMRRARGGMMGMGDGGMGGGMDGFGMGGMGGRGMGPGMMGPGMMGPGMMGWRG
ncbi:MAG: Spy/CpxP family protein refolding chaperone [Hyphomicrobiales bacterium]